MQTSNTGKLYLDVAEGIGGSIRSGALGRRDRVPSVRQMARQRGVSVSSVALPFRWVRDARLIGGRPRSG